MNELRQMSRSDPALLSMIPRADELAFVRVFRILSQSAPLVLSDGRFCLLVQGSATDPAWVWTAKDCPDETLQSLLATILGMREIGHLPGVVSKGRCIRLMELAYANLPTRRQRINVYRMDALIPHTAPGMRVGGMEVSPETAGALIASLAAADSGTLSNAMRREMGLAFCQSPDAAAWRAPDGAIASIAKRADVRDRYADLHTVVTAEPYRNRGYAKALLSALCREILDAGRTPMLYADRDYAPSNAAYRAIGFTEAALLYALRFDTV